MAAKKPSAKTAIEILTELGDKAGEDALAYWVTPNTVLTFSGARAGCDGVFYQQKSNVKVLKTWVDELDGHIKILKSIADVYFGLANLDKSAWGEPIAVYDMTMTQGLEYALDQTKLVGKEKITLLETKLGPPEVRGRMHEMLKRNENLKDVSQDHYGDIIAGILLGYPDKAILNTLGEWDNLNPFKEPLIEADIRGARYYECPIPVYDYPRRMIADADIKAHEKLWSGILKDFYESDFHRKLAKSPKFIEKAKLIGVLNT